MGCSSIEIILFSTVVRLFNDYVLLLTSKLKDHKALSEKFLSEVILLESDDTYHQRITIMMIENASNYKVS